MSSRRCPGRARAGPRTKNYRCDVVVGCVCERLIAWLGNFRRLVVRYVRHAFNCLGFVHLGCILILLRQGL